MMMQLIHQVFTENVNSAELPLASTVGSPFDAVDMKITEFRCTRY